MNEDQWEVVWIEPISFYFTLTHRISSKETESWRMVKVQVNGLKGDSIIVIGQK